MGFRELPGGPDHARIGQRPVERKGRLGLQGEHPGIHEVAHFAPARNVRRGLGRPGDRVGNLPGYLGHEDLLGRVHPFQFHPLHGHGDRHHDAFGNYRLHPNRPASLLPDVSARKRSMRCSSKNWAQGQVIGGPGLEKRSPSRLERRHLDFAAYRHLKKGPDSHAASSRSQP